MKPGFIILIIIIALQLATGNAHGQDSTNVGKELSLRRLADSVRASVFLRAAENSALAQHNDSVNYFAQKSLEIASTSDFMLIEASVYELLGSLSDKLYNWEETLACYLKAAAIFNKINMADKEAEIYRVLGTKYFDKGLYKKSASCFEQEFSLYKTGKEDRTAKAADNAALSFYYLPDDTLALKWFTVALHYYEKLNDEEAVNRCSQKLAALNLKLGDYNKSNEKYNQLLKKYALKNAFADEAIIYNNIGFLKFRLKDYTGAIDDFRAAAENSAKSGKDPGFLTDVYSNIAICHQTLGQQQAMMDNFKIALRYATESKREDEAARLNHLISLIYFRKGDNYHAELYCQDCIESAKKSSDYSMLQECFSTYSDIMEKGNDFVKALDYYEKYLSIRDSIDYSNRIREQKESDRQAEYEALEQRIRLDIADEQIQGMAMKTLRADSSRKQNEIKLLLNQQQLDQSEKERLAQSLALEKEQFVLNLKNQEVNTLHQQQKYDSLQLKQKGDEALVLDRENKLLESEKQQQQRDIQKQKQIKRLALGLSVLIFLVAAMTLAGLFSIRRKNQKLAESKREIEKINADLEIKNREIIIQKDIIEQKNRAITDSIQYASRIQTAVLPPVTFLTEWGIDNFILYKPKDIVSGDFYWGVKKQGKIIAAAADCTGHGVPGAFMSMLGHAFLDEIINKTEPENAALILNSLRDEVINTLKQRGMVGEARDGMDISLCIIDIGSGKLEFAGANNPLYLIRNGKLIKVPADKMPIGIHVTTTTPFTNNTVDIVKGDYMYLFSDGYADQFGGPKGRKFMYKQFQDLLLNIHNRPMVTQKEILDNSFLKWKGDREQVDDVLVIGMHI